MRAEKSSHTEESDLLWHLIRIFGIIHGELSMANQEHLDISRNRHVAAWNKWRSDHPDIQPDFREADLHGLDLAKVDFRSADLSNANLFYAILRDALLNEAVLHEANIEGTILVRAKLSGAILRLGRLKATNFTGEDLSGADLSDASLVMTNLYNANLENSNLERTYLVGIIFGDANLSNAEGLENCRHLGPSIIDHSTLMKSGNLPLKFLRGCGLPDDLIKYLPSLRGDPSNSIPASSAIRPRVTSSRSVSMPTFRTAAFAAGSRRRT
jgi:hypothetical protein